MVLASLCPKGWASSVQVFIDRVDLYAPGAETRCSAVWSAHLFWVQRAIGSNPVTLIPIFFFVCLIMGLDFNLLFIKMESLILAKGLSFFYKGSGLQEVSFWRALGVCLILR